MTAKASGQFICILRGDIMWIGIFLTAVGILYLLHNMGIIYGNVWDWAWPILLICLGIGMIFKPKRHRDRDKTESD